MDVIATLQMEEARLEEAMRALPVYRQLEAVRAALGPLMAAYGHTNGEPYKNDVTTGHGMLPSTASSRGSQTAGTTATTKRIAEAEMRRTGQRLPSTALLPLLIAQGIVVSGKNPQAVVASALSADKKMFDNKRDARGVGYGLVEWSAADAASSEITSEQPQTPEVTSSPGGEAPTGGRQPPASFADLIGQEREGMTADHPRSGGT